MDGSYHNSYSPLGQQADSDSLPRGHARSRQAFSKVFWGLLLVLLDFSINHFDLLPDGIGYLIVAAGCGGLTTLSPRFSTARMLSFVLAALWLFGLAIDREFASVFGIVTTLVNCAFFWQLLGGIAEFANDCRRPDIATQAQNYRIAYLVMMLVTTCVTLIFSGQNVGLLVILILIPMLVLMVLILKLIHQTKIKLGT